MNKSEKIYIAGHKGMVGSAILRLLKGLGFRNIITRSRKELDLLETDLVASFFAEAKPDIVILAAAKVGGIQANIQSPAEFLYENLVIQNNIIHQSYRNKVKRLVFLGSSCVYPRKCPQPMKEKYLMTGLLEPTNEAYALAKIAGLKMCQFYYHQYRLKIISLIPCNLYGPNDSFDLERSHVLSALVKKFVDAQERQLKRVVLWGTGTARREFMHVDDLAKATVFLLQNYNSPDFINVGTGKDVTIKKLAEMIASKIGYKEEILWDTSKPNGMPRKCLDVSKITKLGFTPSVKLEDGIIGIIKEYQKIKKAS